MNGSRALTPAELSRVRQALLDIDVGDRGLCGADKGLVKFDIERNASVGRNVDDFYGFQPPPPATPS